MVVLYGKDGVVYFEILILMISEVLNGGGLFDCGDFGGGDLVECDVD